MTIFLIKKAMDIQGGLYDQKNRGKEKKNMKCNIFYG